MSFENKSPKEIILSLVIYTFLMPFVIIGTVAFVIYDQPWGALIVLAIVPYGLWIDYRFELLFFKWKRIK